MILFKKAIAIRTKTGHNYKADPITRRRLYMDEKNEISLSERDYGKEILDIIRSEGTDTETRLLLEEYHENDIASEYERSWNPPATPNKNRIGHVFTHPMRPILSRQRTVPRLASISYLI
jgi:hypothetical protein